MTTNVIGHTPPKKVALAAVLSGGLCENPRWGQQLEQRYLTNYPQIPLELENFMFHFVRFTNHKKNMRKQPHSSPQDLINIANEARKNAYAKYSNYPVGAALLGKSGKIYKGVNVENAAYPVTICAERVAIFKAVSEGEREFNAISVVTNKGGSPCGSCRQVLAEFGLDIIVYIADGEERLLEKTTVRELLPGAFGAGDLV